MPFGLVLRSPKVRLQNEIGRSSNRYPDKIYPSGLEIGNFFTADVTQSSDDGEEHGDGVIILDAAMRGAGVDDYCAARFQYVNVPQGATATVIRAYLTLELDDSDKNDPDGDWYCQAADNAATFTTTGFDMSSRPRTTATAPWVEIDIGVAGTSVSTPDLSALVQEVIDRPGWVEGNAMAFIYAHNSATNKIQTAGWDSTTRMTPRLTIEWEPAEVVPITGTIAVTQDDQTCVATGFIDGGSYLLLDGTSGCFADTPDHASLHITGDIDMRAEYGARPGAGNQVYICKMRNNVGGQRSYTAGFSPFALLVTEWTVNGTDALNDFLSGVAQVWNGAVRHTLRVNNGAGGKTFTYYWGPDLESVTQIGQQTTAGTTSIFAGTDKLTIGADSGNFNDFFVGSIGRVQIRDGIDGTIVANPDFRVLPPGTTSFVDSAGRTWTLHGTAAIAFVPKRIGTLAATQDDQTSTATGTVTPPAVVPLDAYIWDGVALVNPMKAYVWQGGVLVPVIDAQLAP